MRPSCGWSSGSSGPLLLLLLLLVRGGQQQKLACPCQENISAHSLLLFLFPSCSSFRTELARSHPLKLAPVRPATARELFWREGGSKTTIFASPFHTPLPSTPRSGLRHSTGIYISLQSARAARTDAGFSSANVGRAPAPPLTIGPSPGSRDPLWMCRLPLSPSPSSSHSALRRPPRLT